MKSRIAETLVFKTDVERVAWFNSLSDQEQDEVRKDAQEIVDIFSVTVAKITANILAWFENASKTIGEVKFVIDSISGEMAAPQKHAAYLRIKNKNA